MTQSLHMHNVKLPIAPVPMKNESIGGWYGRTSLAHGVHFHYKLPVIELRQYRHNTISKKLICELSGKLEELTDIDTAVWQDRFEPEVKLTNMWLKYQPEAKVCFPQLPHYYCIECFFEDLETRGKTCYKSEWQSPFVLTCHEHKSPLTDQKFISYDNVFCELSLKRYSSKINYTGGYVLPAREVAHISGTAITPMARRVSDLFSAKDTVALGALKDLDKYTHLSHARSAAIAILQLLCLRSGFRQNQNVGLRLFKERDCKQFPSFYTYSKGGVVEMRRQELTSCFEQVGWFICNPKKFRPYGLQDKMRGYSRIEDLNKLFFENPLTFLCALLLRYQRDDFYDEIKEHHPIFAKEWRQTIDTFYEACKE